MTDRKWISNKENLVGLHKLWLTVTESLECLSVVVVFENAWELPLQLSWQLRDNFLTPAVSFWVILPAAFHSGLRASFKSWLPLFNQVKNPLNQNVNVKCLRAHLDIHAMPLGLQDINDSAIQQKWQTSKRWGKMIYFCSLKDLLYHWSSMAKLIMVKCLLIMPKNSNFITAAEFRWLGLLHCSQWLRWHFGWLKVSQLWNKQEESEFNFNAFMLIVGVLHRCVIESFSRNLHCRLSHLVFCLEERSQSHVHCPGSKLLSDTCIKDEKKKEKWISRSNSAPGFSPPPLIQMNDRGKGEPLSWSKWNKRLDEAHNWQLEKLLSKVKVRLFRRLSKRTFEEKRWKIETVSSS